MPSITRGSAFQGREEPRQVRVANSSTLVRTLEELTPEEIAAIGTEGARKARKASFEAGLPVTFEKNGRVMREWRDGRLEDLGPSYE